MNNALAMMFRISKFFALLFILIACEKQNSGTNAQGLYDGRFTNKERVLWVGCFENKIPDDVWTPMLAKINDQFHERTRLRFQFNDTCKGDENFSIFSNFDPLFPSCRVDASGSAVLAYVAYVGGFQGKRRLVICDANLRRSFGENLGNGSAFVALHELGHVVGLMHEHERDDAYAADETCVAARAFHKMTLPMGRIKFGDFDAMSVMNYCHPTMRSHGLKPFELSKGDLALIDEMTAKGTIKAIPPVINPTEPDTTVTNANGTEFFVYCKIDDLQECVVKNGGGAGCLSPARAKECTAFSAGLKKKIPYLQVSECMRAEVDDTKKWACLNVAPE